MFLPKKYNNKKMDDKQDNTLEEWLDIKVDQEEFEKKRQNLRKLADKSKIKRSQTFICVLENPSNISNIGAIIRNVDTLGISKLYIVDGNKVLPHNWTSMRKNNQLLNSSSSAVKWTFVKKFLSTSECLEHLEKNNYKSYITSPHIKGKNNINLGDGNFTDKRIAVWFGNESKGISDELTNKINDCIQIEMTGIIESMNLAVSTGIILYTIMRQRYKFIEERNQKKNEIKINQK